MVLEILNKIAQILNEKKWTKTEENVNNINIPHLHFGMQLIFDKSQEDGNNEIWIDVYNIIEFLKKNRSEVYMNNKDTKDYVRKNEFYENAFFE